MTYPVLVAAAGGASRCMGDKMTRDYRNRPLLHWLLDTLCAHPDIGEVIVVTGHRRSEVEKLILPFPQARGLYNPHWAQGLSTTLKTGVSALPQDSSFLTALGDTPFFAASTLDMVLPQNATERNQVRQPSYLGQPGHPMYFPGWTRPDWQKLQGDRGARQLFQLWQEKTVNVPVSDPGILRDFDTPQDFESGTPKPLMETLS